MFDEIIVPKSYLRGLLSKEEEKLLKQKHIFQTKDLENCLFKYKVYAQCLYRLETPTGLSWDSEEPEQDKKPQAWKRIHDVNSIVFYGHVKDKKENEWWLEFQFTFHNGKLDKKKLIKCKLETTKAEKDSIDKMWDAEQEIFDKYRKCFKYRFFLKLERIFQKLTNWARKKHSIPFSLRKMAYEKSGRLESDPDSLKLYIDN